MENANKINIHSLQEEAEKSEDNEAFQVLARIKNCRVGVGTRLESDDKPSFFIEVLVSLCTSNRSVNLDHIEKKLLLLRRLEERGYILSCEEDSSVSCELIVPSKNLMAECETTVSVIKKYTE